MAIAGRFLERLCSRSLIAVSIALIPEAVYAQDKPDLTSLSVDDLMNVEVTSVSRKAQKLSDTAAAVFVITQDDIQRSGATTIPEILRMVPGLDVARVNGSVWAISARGSNGQFANKLLVMIDGRSVYTPLFSGVFWDTQDTLLEDIDRIEVIRGPGGTLWGANAVNGIINIITKHAIDTQGAMVVARGGGNGSSAAARYGGSIGRSGYYRAYAKSFDRPPSIAGTNATPDAWALGRVGFRGDWTALGGDTFTAQGDLYRGSETTMGAFDPANPFVDRSALNRVSGANAQFRWTATQSSRSDTTLQAFFDYTDRAQSTFVDHRKTYDIDFQNHLRVGGRNDAVWGAELRSVDDRVRGPVIRLVRDSDVLTTVSAFVQDEMRLTPRLRMTAGTKVQYDRITSVELQPTLRFLFKANERNTFWAAATSAVRNASEIELFGRVNVGAFPDGYGGAGLVVLTGNPELQPERIDAFEAGYRWQAASSLSIDMTAFHNHMHGLVRTANGSPFVDSAGRFIVPINFSNSLAGDANGAEFLATDSIRPDWNVALGYAFYRASSRINDISTARHHIQLRSSIQLPRRLEMDTSAYYVGRLAAGVPPFLRLDAQLRWRAPKRWELSISGENLLRARHGEFVGTNGESDLATPVQRTVNGKVTWRF